MTADKHEVSRVCRKGEGLPMAENGRYANRETALMRSVFRSAARRTGARNAD
jgi:hypothetical protein